MSITMDEGKGKNNDDTTDDSNVMIGESKSDSKAEQTSQPIEFSYTKNETEEPVNNPVVSYASASRTGAVPKKLTVPHKINTVSASKCIDTMHFEQIITYHNEGIRTLIILRGLPGSGKSYLAKKIIDSIYNESDQQNYTTHIFCTDDYFMRGGIYVYNRHELHYAHGYNQARANHAMTTGISPVIIDNTHTEIWEMEFYVRLGVQNGYIIEVLEPNTRWAKNIKILQEKNIHDVPLLSIKRMLARYEGGVNGTDLILSFHCDYSVEMRPPVKRTYPPLDCSGFKARKINNLESPDFTKDVTPYDSYDKSQPVPIDTMTNELNTTILPNTSSIAVINETEILENISTDVRYEEVQKNIEEIEKVEYEWENGENWDDTNNLNCKTSEINNISTNSKPQRQHIPLRHSQNLMLSVKESEDWSNISMYMPPWNVQENITTGTEQTQPEHVKKVSSYTCMESGDSDICSSKNPLKIVSATPRDINEYHVETTRFKIPESWMLDKSTSTYDNMNGYKCPNEEQHFKAFSQLFKSIPKSDLRDIFDKCHGDVNWAVGLVLDSMSNKSFSITDRKDLSDIESDSQYNEQCECLAVYNILPHYNVTNSTITTEMEQSSNPIEWPQMQVKKDKKEISDESIQLKRQIEQNIVIADNHYSDHCLKIRKMRRGEFDSEKILNTLDAFDNVTTPAIDQNVSCTEELSRETCTQEVSDDASNACREDTVSIDLPIEFITQIDKIFGRKHMNYPENMTSRIDIPMSIINEINALWTQTLAYHLEENDHEKQIMIQQDEEFARQLAVKEAELIRAGKEPEIPDFKEIMDMDFAISLYQKDVAEWRNNERTDLASKMSREKLHNLFPEIDPDTLSELLQAHDNNFQSTVEVLLMSTGKLEVLQNENGINKFIMEKEMERQEKILEMERKALSEVEWPLLNKNVHVDMAEVESYRKQANQHLKFRNTNYQKAQDYIRRGMTTIAGHYSEVAAYHKQKFEQANSFAAASLMQIHANNSSDNSTIDLHFLRVGEAKETLDLFLDTHIQKLKEMLAKNRAPINYTLYFITGRGLHSNGKPRVKPAVIKRLLERGLKYAERNPGLLTAKVSAHSLLSHEIE